MLTSHASKIMLKILQARLQQYVNQELPHVQAGFRKGRGTRDQTAKICWIIETAKELKKKKNHLFLFHWLCYKACDCVDYNKLWKTLKEMGIPDHLACLLRNLYVGQEAKGEKVEAVTDFFLLGSKITAEADCSHEIRRQLLLGRKAMTNLDSILKSKDMSLPTKVCIVRATVFPVVMYGSES